MARAWRRSSAGFERTGSMPRMVRMPHMETPKTKNPDPRSRIGVVRGIRNLGETLAGPRAIRAGEPIGIAVGPQEGEGHEVPGSMITACFTDRQTLIPILAPLLRGGEME